MTKGHGAAFLHATSLKWGILLLQGKTEDLRTLFAGCANGVVIRR